MAFIPEQEAKIAAFHLLPEGLQELLTAMCAYTCFPMIQSGIPKVACDELFLMRNAITDYFLACLHVARMDSEQQKGQMN